VKVAVTGGSGVVGSAVTRHLVTAGHEVRALARSDGAAARVRELGARPIIGDLSDPGSLTRLADGVDWMFHVAGVNELCPVDRDRMWAVNVLGTRAVLDACSRLGVHRLIHTSSAVVIGEERGSVGSETTTHRGRYLSHYERTKAEAERLALGNRGDLEVVVVSPSSVQGPGRATGTGRLLLEACRGRLPFLVDTVFSIVDIDDCARGHLLAAESGVAGERYILSGATIDTRAAMAMLTRITGREVRPRYLRPGVVEALGWVVGSAFGLVGRQPPLCPEAMRVMLHGHSYDGSRATAHLGLRYTPLEQTFTRVVDWFFQEGLLA
jgi:dihydroflavonol-4-reductase